MGMADDKRDDSAPQSGDAGASGFSKPRVVARKPPVIEGQAKEIAKEIAEETAEELAPASPAPGVEADETPAHATADPVVDEPVAHEPVADEHVASADASAEPVEPAETAPIEEAHRPRRLAGAFLVLLVALAGGGAWLAYDPETGSFSTDLPGLRVLTGEPPPARVATAPTTKPTAAPPAAPPPQSPSPSPSPGQTAVPKPQPPSPGPVAVPVPTPVIPKPAPVSPPSSTASAPPPAPVAAPPIAQVPPPQSGANAAVDERLTAIDRHISAIDDRIAMLSSAPKAAADAAAGLATRLSSLETQVAALDKRIADLDAKLAAPKTDTRVPESRDVLAGQQAEQSAARSVVAQSMIGAIQSGLPFATEVAALRALGVGDDRIGRIEPLSRNGVATLGKLREEFAAVRPKIVSVIKSDPDASWSQRLVARLSSVVTIRPITERSGPSPEAIASRIDAALQRGDLASALTEYAALPAADRTLAKPWYDLAMARITAEANAKTILAESIAALGKPKS
jgi:hypothetical protein